MKKLLLFLLFTTSIFAQNETVRKIIWNDTNSVHNAKISANTDSLNSHNSRINLAIQRGLDSASTFRSAINTNLDSLNSHNLRINSSIQQSLDSLSIHRTAINKEVDSIASHNVKLNARADSLTAHRNMFPLYPQKTLNETVTGRWHFTNMLTIDSSTVLFADTGYVLVDNSITGSKLYQSTDAGNYFDMNVPVTLGNMASVTRLGALGWINTGSYLFPVFNNTTISQDTILTTRVLLTKTNLILGGVLYSGGLSVNNNIFIPTSATDGSAGCFYQNGQPFIHTNGNDNLFLGNTSGNFTLSTAQFNIGIGTISLAQVSTGNYNIGIGGQSLLGLTTGSNNTALGAFALRNTTGDDNTALGTSAGIGNTTGYDNTYLGSGSGYYNTTGWGNTWTGWSSGHNQLSGKENTGTGISSFFNFKSGDDNAGHGGGAYENLLYGSGNTSEGFRSVIGLKMGNENLGLGHYAGRYLTTSDSSIMIGANSGFISDSTGNNKFIIANNNSSAFLYGNIANNNLLMGATEASHALNTTAMLELRSTTQGFMPPRMTTTQRDAIVSPVEGLMIYNLTTHRLNLYDGSAWKSVAFE